MIHPRIVCFPFHTRAKIRDRLGFTRRISPAAGAWRQPWFTIVLPNSYPCTQASKVSISFVGHTAHCGTESEHQALNGSHNLSSFLYTILVLFGTKFKYSRKRRQDDEGKQSSKADIRQLVLTFCLAICCCLLRKLKLLMPAFRKKYTVKAKLPV